VLVFNAFGCTASDSIVVYVETLAGEGRQHAPAKDVTTLQACCATLEGQESTITFSACESIVPQPFQLVSPLYHKLSACEVFVQQALSLAAINKN